MSSLGPPPAPDHLGRFPRYDLYPSVALARIHSSQREPWYFSSGLSGRFDLPTPYGTCYLAETPTGAFAEVFQRWIAQRIPIPRSEVTARRISELPMPKHFSLADCADPRALAFGATGTMHATPNRSLTQEWAAAFHAAGFDGVRYLLSTDPTMQLVGFALFHTSGQVAWPVSSNNRIDDTLLAEIEHLFGVLVR